MGKLRRSSKLSDAQLQESRHKVFSKIHFINEELIPSELWLEAENTVKDIDLDDSDFVALTNFLTGRLWTGDKELYKGLKTKSYQNVVTTSELLTLRESLA